MTAEIDGGAFVATVEESKGQEHRTTIRMKDDPSRWSLKLGEQDLKDLVNVTNMGRLMNGAGGLIGALALSEGRRQPGEAWSVSEGTTREYKQGRFGITVERLWVEDEQSQLTARLTADGKPCLAASAQDVGDLYR